MSKEFEEIVLKKLEKLDNIEIQVENLGTEIGTLKTGLGNLGTEVGTLKIGLGNLGTEVGNFGKEIKSLKTTVGKLEMEVKDTGEVVNYLNQKFTEFDYDINKKIDTLFDAFTTNKEQDLVHENEIASLNEKVFKQDIKISNLENKILTA